MAKSPIVSRTLLHSCYVPNIGNGKDALVVSEMVESAEGEVVPKLVVFESPEVSFWVTQERNRTHPDKKEFESLSNLDEFKVPYKEKDKEIFKVLNGFYPNFLTPTQRRALYQSPYLYGGNIGVEALIAMKYRTLRLKNNTVAHAPITGFFDIEQSLLPSSMGKLPLMVFTSENKVFLAMKKSFMYEPRNGEHVPVTVEDVRKAVHEHIDPLIESIFLEKSKDLKDYRNRLPFSYEFFVGEDEIDMIRWIFGKMHETKTSFIGVWNLGFDIPEIIKFIEEAGIPLDEIFADPDLRKSLKISYASYREDKRDVHHWSQKWHWLANTAHFQFIDSLALYSYIRQVDGKEASYALDDILIKFGVGGKLKLNDTEAEPGTPDWHREMLSKHFINYACYAIWDGVGLQILEWLNNDLTAMMLLGDTTPPKFFPNQTIRVTNTMFQEYLPTGWVLGTGVDVETIRDDDLLTEGGAVLVPQHLVAKGMKLFEEWPNHETHCYAFQNDLDFSAQYPTACSVLNISKQTKVATILAIKDDNVNARYGPEEAIEVLCSYLITPNSNGRELGVEFFNLPDFKEMQELFVTRKRI